MPVPTASPSPPFHATLELASEADTARLAERMAPLLRAGDVLLLEGPIGAGKSFFARALIRARLKAADAPPEDIPSPTFTLVQTYDAGETAIWHADLYRLGHPAEVAELGLEEAFETAICLVEWPDRLGLLTPATALTVALAEGAIDISRRVTLAGPASWSPRLAPVLEQLDA